MDHPWDSCYVTASWLYLPTQKGPMYNKGNKRIGKKAKEERAYVRATQRFVVT